MMCIALRIIEDQERKRRLEDNPCKTCIALWIIGWHEAYRRRDEISKSILSVQPINGPFHIWNMGKSEKKLEEEGYKPVSGDTRLMWSKEKVKK